MTSKPNNPWPIGTKFDLKKGKGKRAAEVIDHLETYNSKGELVGFRYVAGYEFMGQIMANSDICHLTICKARNEPR